MKKYDNIISRFDDIQELSVSEEILGAYLEGNLVGSDLRDVQNCINTNDSLSSFVDELQETSFFDLHETYGFDTGNNMFDVDNNSSFVVNNDMFNIQTMDNINLEDIVLPHIPDDDSITNIDDSLNKDLSGEESNFNQDESCINNINDTFDIL